MTDVEKILKQIFHRSERWNAILLLEEIDIYLLPRKRAEIARNGIVGIFLRHLEHFPGIVFMTTNRLAEVDRAILARVDLPLYYPTLNEHDTAEIFKLHMEKLKLHFQTPQYVKEQSVSFTALRKTTLYIDENVIYKWCRQEFITSTHKKYRSWWEGRLILSAFYSALALAERERGNNNRTIVNLKAEHFRRVAEMYSSFERHRTKILGGEVERDLEWHWNSESSEEEDDVVN